MELDGGTLLLSDVQVGKGQRRVSILIVKLDKLVDGSDDFRVVAVH
ncbi:MAG: hypothetical protein V3U65_20245 [Granulosicoccaceae bacterium]